ncbi:MAG: export ABC transporter ATP-binding protein [Planctomycetaceae bacterium]|nr:export ABC transporter ATP-binding protein [Planctomycetaceae bacterium]
MEFLNVSRLKKAFGQHVAVDDLSFSVYKGGIFGFLGPNGAGKTTTMSMICGLLAPDSGSVELDGKTLEPTQPETRRMLGVVPQDLALYPDLTGLENLRFFGQLFGLDGSRLNERLDVVLQQIGLVESAGNAVSTYSGGMKRRLNFGAAILHQPSLLILDEPTVGVDPQSRSHLLDCVRSLSNAGTTVLFASHYMEEVQSICQRVAIIDHGKLLTLGTVRELLGHVDSAVSVVVDGVIDAASLPISNVELASADQECSTFSLPVNDNFDALLTEFLSHIHQLGRRVRSIESREANLEQLFLQLTGHSLRD